MAFGEKFKKIFKKPDKEKQKKLREDIESGGGLEKKDLPAMILSAYLVIIPVALIALLLIYFAARLFLGIW